ncbi:MAG: hypothetical protein JW718_02110 [Desulfovibrionaceae bacterium]|nr:hypothetical protein [Desulfovibrionaceae bacterium]
MNLLRESGLALDFPGLLRLVRSRAWLRVLAFRFLRARVSPDILGRVERLGCGLEQKAELFNMAISQIRVGETYKTGCAGRTALTDAAIAERAREFEAPRVLDAGASDGLGSLDLIHRLGPEASLTLADRHPEFWRRPFPLGAVFLDGDRRLLSVKFLFLYLYLGSDPGRGGPLDARGLSRIDTTNPLVRERLGPFAVRRLDVFSGVLEPGFELIKCANLLNVEYFELERIAAAAANLARSLVPGGYLFIAQSNARFRDSEAYVLLRRQGGDLVLVEEKNGHEALALFSGGGR